MGDRYHFAAPARLATCVLIVSFVPCVIAAPPKVLKAVPDNRETQVDPSTRQIRVTFDQPMDTGGGWSIVGGGPTYPTLVGRPRWEDDRTFVLSVRLKPEQKYWLSINSDRFGNFTNAKGESAVPYPIAFTTRAAASTTRPATQRASVEDNREAVTILHRGIDDDYSYRDRLGVDWDARFTEYAPQLESANTPAEFARLAAELLSVAKDPHLWLKVADETVGTHPTGSPANYDLSLLPKVVPNWKDHGGGVFTGRFDDGIGYVLIDGWGHPQRERLEAAYALLTEAPNGLIVDVRPNGGGDELFAREFAGCFVDAPKVYSRNTLRRGGRETGPYDRVIEPNKARPAYRGRVAVLIGPRNLSSNESFILMMKQSPNCTLVGEKTYGSSGNPRPLDLGNGVTAFLPSWQDQFPDGKPLEGIGIQPDVAVRVRADAMKGRDSVLDNALVLLRRK